MGNRVVQPPGTALTAAARSSLIDAPEPSWRFLLQRGLPTFAVEGFAPILLFYVVWNLAGLVPAILVATAVSGSIVAWQVRRGNGGALAVVALIFVLIQAVVGLASNSATVYLAQPVVLSACWGVAYFGSVVVRRPLIGIFANVWYPFPPAFRASEPYRHEFSLQSIVWGIYCLARAGLRLAVLLGPGIGSFVVVSLLTGAPIFAALVFWGIWHARRTFSRLASV
jgi:hypothetical protein